MKKTIRKRSGNKRRNEVTRVDGGASPSTLYSEALAMARNGETRTVVPLLRAAATAGHAMAAHALAIWYLRGIGVRKNFAKAVALERIAAQAGISEAIYNLAISHEKGQGAKRNPVEALRLYRAAARRGDVDAMYDVGRCLFYGIGTAKNERLGRRWVLRSEASRSGPRRGEENDKP
ncbi:MAG: tetratricopeptide repeat protein [Myxococcales bacterium]